MTPSVIFFTNILNVAIADVTMITFKTRTGNIVDIDSIIDVLAGERAGTWYIDTMSGVVIDSPLSSFSVCIGSVSRNELEGVMREFVETFESIFDSGKDIQITTKLKEALDGNNPYDDTLRIIEKDDPWMVGWHTWRDDVLWEKAIDLLHDSDAGIKEELELDCSCAGCHLLAKNIEQSSEDTDVVWNFDNISTPDKKKKDIGF